MLGWFEREGLIADDTPNVSAQENAETRYHPRARDAPADPAGRDAPAGSVGQTESPARVFADITWVGFTGSAVPNEYSRAFAAARDGRDAAVGLVQAAACEGRELRGFEVDRACRDVIERAATATAHPPTGHAWARPVTATAYTWMTTRRTTTAGPFPHRFHHQPGIYTSTYGVRTEINMFIGNSEATVTGAMQTTSSRWPRLGPGAL